MSNYEPMKRPLSKAGRLVLLLRLRDIGILEGETLQRLGDILGVNRSTILRDLRLLNRVEDEYRRLLEEQPWLDRSHVNILQATGYVTIAQAAEETGYTRNHIGILARNDKIKAEKINGRWWVHLRSLQEYASAPTQHGKRGPYKIRYKEKE